jgi:uncharacterized lipoprotein YbaY
MRSVPRLAALAVIAVLAGCATPTPAGQVALSGMVATSDGSAMPVGAQVLIRLEEQAIADTDARQIATATIDADGKGEAKFRLLAPSDDLGKAVSPGWRVRVQKDGRLLFTNDTRHPFEPGRAARIVVVPVP